MPVGFRPVAGCFDAEHLAAGFLSVRGHFLFPVPFCVSKTLYFRLRKLMERGSSPVGTKMGLGRALSISALPIFSDNRLSFG